MIPIGDSSNTGKRIGRMKTGYRFFKLPWCSSTSSWIPRIVTDNILSMLGSVDEFYVSICTDYSVLYEVWEQLYMEGKRKGTRVPFITYQLMTPFGFMDPRDMVVIAYPNPASMRMVLRYLRYNPDVYPLFFVRDTTEIAMLNEYVWDVSSNGRIIISARNDVARYIVGIVKRLINRGVDVIVDKNILKSMRASSRPRYNFIDIDESILLELLSNPLPWK